MPQGLSTLLIPMPFLIGSIYYLALRVPTMPQPIQGMAIAMGILYLLWVILEAKVSMGEMDKGQSTFDRWTCEIYNTARWATTFAAVAVPMQWQEFGAWAPLGMLLFVSAIAFRLIAIRTLGRFYSHRVRIVDGHHVVSTGPYRFLRHPAYTGMVFSHLGWVLFFFSWPALLVWLLFLVPIVVLRILVEEKTLLKQISGYAEFAKTRKRIIPFLW